MSKGDRHTGRRTTRLGKWERRLLVQARQREIDARKTDSEPAQRRLGVDWGRHVVGDPPQDALQADVSAWYRTSLSRASKALRVLEEEYGMVRVHRVGGGSRGRVERYQLLALGRDRADEIIAHGGKTRDMARRERQAIRATGVLARQRGRYQAQVDLLMRDLDDPTFISRLVKALDAAHPAESTPAQALVAAEERGDYILIAAMKWLRLAQMRQARRLIQPFVDAWGGIYDVGARVAGAPKITLGENDD